MFDAAEDGRPGASPVTVLSRRFWVRRFSGDAAAVGRTIRLNGQAYTVIGIAPEGFQGTGITAADAWMPMNVLPAMNGQSEAVFTNRDGGWLVIGGRLKPGVSVEAAAGEVAALGQALAREYPDTPVTKGLLLLPSSMVPGNRALVVVFVALLMGMVSFVLLVACANVSGILLARGAARAARDCGAVVARRRPRAARPASLHGDGAAVWPGGFESMELGLGLPGASADEEFQPDSNIVDPGYFATLRIPILAGRDFNMADRDGGQLVAIVGETAARRFWPGESAIGKHLSQRTRTGTRDYRVVGVAGEVTSTSLIDGMSQSFVYVPVQQAENFTSSLTVITRARPGGSVAHAVRKLVGSMNPDLPLAATPTLADSVALGLMPQRIAASIAGSLGTVGLVLAAIGLYGVTAFTVTRRLREFGIRVALGARSADILRIVLRQGMALTLCGCGIGVVLAGALAHLLGIFLLGVPALDPLTFAGSVALFVLVALAACYGPARRAMGTDPLSVLRCD